MKKLVSKDGKKVTYNGKSMKIYNALYAIYENERVNKVTINGRLVWFDNTGWQYDDTIPAAIKGQIVARYEKDAKRLEL